MFSKIEVKGEGAHPLYRYLTNEARGVLWTKSIKWNFTKFLVDRRGNVVRRYAPKAKPEALGRDIEALL
jgi:glutathione peroxidase